MDARTRAELAQALRRQRGALPKRFFDAETDLRSIAEDREPELTHAAIGTLLFEERGTLEEIVRFPTDWFRDHFPRRLPASR